ncbi:MAG: spore maturation protein [bacterium]|nr:spore maturation protein [bacterium]
MSFIIPAIIALTVITALLKRTPVYNSFTSGAAEGIQIIIKIFPAVAAVMIASYMLRASGAMDMLCGIISPLTSCIGMPAEVLPLAMIRPVSGSGSLGILTDILNTYGADSDIGKIASVITGSTETTFYCICVYFSETKVKYSSKVIPCALIGDIVGMILGIIMVKI